MENQPAKGLGGYESKVRDDQRKIWCNAHQRWATFLWKPKGQEEWFPTCDPKLGGIMLPCSCVDLTDIAVIEDKK